MNSLPIPRPVPRFKPGDRVRIIRVGTVTLSLPATVVEVDMSHFNPLYLLDAGVGSAIYIAELDLQPFDEERAFSARSA